MSTITFSVFPTAPALHRDVECIRLSVHTGTKALATKICPNGLPGIVFQMGQDGSAISSISTRSAKISTLPALFLHGTGAEPSVMQFAAGPFSTIQIVFKPHAMYSIFHIDSWVCRSEAFHLCWGTPRRPLRRSRDARAGRRTTTPRVQIR